MSSHGRNVPIISLGKPEVKDNLENVAVDWKIIV
jgi:hypothetical protein